MSVCTFFGHRECWDLAPEALEAAIADLIAQGVDTFYVGYQGQFDRFVLACLRKLAVKYPYISYSVVLVNLKDLREEFRTAASIPKAWNWSLRNLLWTGEITGWWSRRIFAYVM